MSDAPDLHSRDVASRRRRKWAAEPCFSAINQGAHARCQVSSTASGRHRGRVPLVPRPPPADATGSAPAAPQVRADRAMEPALSTRGSGSVSVPVLSNTTVSTSASRSIASAAIEDHTRPEQRADSHDLNSRDRQRQRAGAGDDENGNRRDDRVVHGRAEQQPGDCGERRGRMDDRRIEPRCPVGKPQISRFGGDRALEQALDIVNQRPAPASVTRIVSAPEIVQAAGVDQPHRLHHAAIRFAGHEAFVDLRKPGLTSPSAGHALAWETSSRSPGLSAATGTATTSPPASNDARSRP